MAIVQAVQNGKLVDTSASATSQSSKREASNGLDKDAFLQLLVAQMKYQDPLEPTDNTEYISQLATFSQLEETQNMQSTLEQSEANNLVGKQVILKVTSATTGETTYPSGQVDYVVHENGKTYLSVNDKLYSLDDLDTVLDTDYMNAQTLANSFSAAIAALPSEMNLTLSDEAKLTAARTGYNGLTAYQKQFIRQSDLQTLEKLEARMAVLKKLAGDTSSDTKTDEKTDGTGEKTDSTEKTGSTENA